MGSLLVQLMAPLAFSDDFRGGCALPQIGPGEFYPFFRLESVLSTWEAVSICQDLFISISCLICSSVHGMLLGLDPRWGELIEFSQQPRWGESSVRSTHRCTLGGRVFSRGHQPV